jgi:RNA polymerase sigma factor (sigma-70 family)
MQKNIHPRAAIPQYLLSYSGTNVKSRKENALIRLVYKQKQLLEDEELIKSCIAEERLAQNRLYERFAPKMLGVCYRYAQTQAESEDILQEGFVKIFNNLKKFRFESSLETWITRIMVNTALNHLRATKKLKMESELDAAENAYEVASFQWHQMDTLVLMKFIQELPTGYRVVLNMYAIEGYSHSEIAEQLGIQESTSRSQFIRAKALLEKKIAGIMEIPQKKYAKG